MRIAIDLRPLMGGKISGVETYILSMLEALFEQDKKNEYILWYNAFGTVDTSLFPRLPKNVSLRRTRFPNKIFNLFLGLLRWPKIDRLLGGVDALWVPDPRPAPVSRKCRKISTFHDLSFEEFRHSFSLRTRLWHKILRPHKEAKEATTIIAVSHFTKERLMTLYGLPEKKITVIYEAAGAHLKSSASFASIQKKYRLPDHYFLCLSTLEPRKNIQGVINAYIEWKRKAKKDIALVIAGKKQEKIFAHLPLEKHSGIHLTGFVDEKDKGALYHHATAFLYPSFYEGFGLPVLEAMKCGTPVITSTLSSLPEVAGQAALLVDPHHLGHIEAAMNRVAEDHDFRQALIERGKKRAGEFSWEKAARDFLSVFCIF